MKTIVKRVSIPPLLQTALVSAILLLTFGLGQAQAGRPVGIDVSSYQGEPNWSSISGDGISFAWAKATEGTTIIDPDFTYNVDNGKGAGVAMGGYDFTHPNENAPGSEAGYFWTEAGAHIKADGYSLMPLVDMEVFDGVTGASSYADWANQWCNDIAANGQSANVNIQPFIYVSACNACEFDSSVSQWLSQIANYNGENDQTGNPWNLCTSCEVFGSGVFSGWQFTDSGSVSGVSGSVDMDVIHAGSLGGVLATAVGVPPGEDLGGTFTANIACCSWQSNRLDLLGVGTDGGIWHKWWDGTQWQPSQTGWQELPLGTGFHGDIGAVSWGPNRIDFFVQNSSHGCSHGYYTGGQWYGMDNRGGTFNSSIGFAASSWGVNRLDVFGVDTSGHLWHTWWDGTQWYAWQNLGCDLTSTPGVVSWGPNRIDVFDRGPDGACYQQYFTGGTWYTSVGHGGQFENYGFAVASEGSGLLDVFGIGGQAKPYELTYNGSWDSWTVYNQGTCSSSPSAVSWSAGRTDFFVRGPNNACYHLYGQ